jgi:hypothetical protein
VTLRLRRGADKGAAFGGYALCRVDVQLISTVAVITADPPQGRKLYMDALGLPLEGESEGYYSSGSIAGIKHFGVARLLTEDGLIVGISYIPSFHDENAA